jgi:hypothetical protein
MGASGDGASLKEALLAELRSQRRLRRDLLEDLGVQPARKIDVFKHPAVLLLIGALCSGLIGAWLTTRWQSREWTRQQAQIQQQKVTDVRHALIHDVATALAETVTACHDVLALSTWRWTPDRQAVEQRIRLDYWLETSRKWRINARVLEQKLRIYYSPEVVKAFETLVDERRVVGVDITNLITAEPARADTKGAAASIDNERKVVLERVTQMDRHLSSLATIMMREARGT